MVKVEELMSRDPCVCSGDDGLERAAKIMWDHDCGCVPVVDSRSGLIGMLTDRDVCMAAYTRGLPLCAIRVREVMAKRCVSCWPDDSIEAALEMMGDYRLRRLPVVDGDNRLVGVIALADISRAAARERRERQLVRIASALAAISTPHGLEREGQRVEIRLSDRALVCVRDASRALIVQATATV
jgi:CBS domain-containing protein